MKLRKLFFVHVLVLLGVCFLLVPTSVTARWHSFKIQYAAKFVCGLKSDPDINRVLRGAYATAINIHNPKNESIVLNLRLALTFPPEGLLPGEVSAPIEVELGPNQALEVDCAEIPNSFLFENPPQTPYTKGFVIIESPKSLDVTAVYTSGPNPASSIGFDVERIQGRSIRVYDY
jgi:hypothetical protein